MARGDLVHDRLFLPRPLGQRLSNRLLRIAGNGRAGLESLALFVRCMLSVSTPLPAGDEAGPAIGCSRFQLLAGGAGRNLPIGRAALALEDGR